MSSEITQLGIAGAALGIILFIIRYFIEAIKDLTQKNEKQTKDFTKVIENHLKHADERQQETNRIFEQINKTLDNIPNRTLDMAKTIYPPKKKPRKEP